MKINTGSVWQAVMAALLACAVLLAVLAYKGLGGWSAEQPAIAEATLPDAIAPQPISLDIKDYRYLFEHSIFMPNHNADLWSFSNGSASTQAEVIASEKIRLISMMITPAVTVAVFEWPGQSPVRVKLGDAVAGSAWRFVRAEPRTAYLSAGNREQALELRVFNGNGGSMPTPNLSATAPAQTAELEPAANTPVTSETEMRNRLAEKRKALETNPKKEE